MIQNNITKSYNALKRLSEMKLPMKKAYELYGVIKDVEELFQMGLNEEKALIDEYKGVISNDGSITFPTPEDAKEWRDKVAKLEAREIEWDHKPVTLTEEDMDSQTISVADMGDLEGFVIFK